MNAVEKTRYANYYIAYDFAWRVSRGVSISTEEIENILIDAFGDIKDKEQIIVEEVIVTADFVKVTVKALPRLAPSEIVSKLKGLTGRRISLVTGVSKVWDRGYACFTKGGTSNEEIINYI